MYTQLDNFNSLMASSRDCFLTWNGRGFHADYQHFQYHSLE